MTTEPVSEIDVWTAIISPGVDDMPPNDAQAILRWSFNDDSKNRMEELADRNDTGILSESEREELEAYVHVGEVVNILQAKARLSLKRSAAANGSN